MTGVAISQTMAACHPSLVTAACARAAAPV